jgi:glycosyltransferase involved in cell wall biosynthesis
LRCAYIASNYPAVSHTFILREIRALRELGVEVDPVAIRRAPREEVLAAVDREEDQRTHALLPTTAQRVLADHVQAFLRSPRAYASTLWTALRLSSGGARATLWQLFYFVEAVMTWAWMRRTGIRHLHAHHGNVACDVALLTTHFGNAAGPGGDDRWTWSFTLHGPVELYEFTTLKLPEKARSADRVAATSDYVRSQLLAHLEPAEWEKVRVVRGGIDPTAFTPPARRESAASDGDLRILNVARLAPVKGQLDLLAAVAQLRERGVQATAVIVGHGPMRATVEAEVRRLGLGTAVTIVGSVPPDEIGRYYADADVFCLPSFAEGVPNVLMEAMATGLPVVSTRLMGIPELVEDGVSGLLVAPARPDQLADALERIARDQALRARLARAGREQVSTRYTIARTASEMRELIADAISSPR